MLCVSYLNSNGIGKARKCFALTVTDWLLSLLPGDGVIETVREGEKRDQRGDVVKHFFLIGQWSVDTEQKQNNTTRFTNDRVSVNGALKISNVLEYFIG